MSRTAFDPRSVGVSSEAICKALASRTFICHLLPSYRNSRVNLPLRSAISACIGDARTEAERVRRTLGSPARFLAFDEREQIGAHLVLVRRAQTMWGALVDLQSCALDELGLELAGIGEWHDLVVVALNDERWHVELLQVLGLIRLRERLNAEVCGREARHHALQPERLAHAFRDLRPWAVVAVERQAEILPELRTVGDDAGAKAVKHRDRQAARVGGRLQHQRRYRGDQHGLGYALRAVAANIAGDFTTARRVADMDGILEVELLDELCEVVGVSIHVVAGPRLARPSVATPVVRDAAIAARGEEKHLVVECNRGERPAVAEDHRLPGAPIFVVNLRAVFSCEGTHGSVSFR